MRHHKSLKLAVCLTAFMSLQGCVSGIVLGALGVASVVNDRRTTATQLEDESIELKANSAIDKDKGLDEHSNISIVSYNRTILLIGQVPNTMLRDRAAKIAGDVENVTRVHNQLRIGNKTALTTRTNDTWLTSKVKVALTADETLKGSQIKVITEHGEVFLMGLVTQQEGNLAAELARNVSGVKQVIKAFEYQ
ncbi:MAG: BON domain-containing protein [Gammaproteobacteria bacterium MedPE]|nr:MAG: BON domain-containing protein [Gammaproteobacteria bacterium MedPE]